MKKGVIAKIAGGILVLGGICGGLFLPDRAERLIRNEISRISAPFPGFDRATCDDVRVSFLQRAVAISNLRLSGPVGELVSREVVLRPGIAAVLALVPGLRSLLPLSGGIAAGDAELRHMAGRITQPGLRSVAVAAQSCVFSGIHIAAPLLDGLRKNGKPALRDIFDHVGVARIEAERLSLNRRTAFVSLTCDSLRLRHLRPGGHAALLEIKRLAFLDDTGVKTAWRGDLALQDISVSPALRDALLSGVRPQTPAAFLQLAAGPLFRKLTLENLALDIRATRILTLRSLVIDQPDNAPVRAVHGRRLTLPALADKTHRTNEVNGARQAVPGQAPLIIDFDMEHREPRKGLFREKLRLDAVARGSMTLEFTHDFPPSRLFVSGNAPDLVKTAVTDAFLRYEDRGGMARILGLLLAEGRLRQQETPAARLPRLLPGEANKPLVEALRTMLTTPGTLEIRQKKGSVLHPAVVMLLPETLGALLDVHATPGRKNIRESLHH